MTYSVNICRSEETPVFVLDYLDRDDKVRLKRRLRGEMGDSTDMIGWGFAVNGDGFLERIEVFAHDALKYCRGGIKGNDSLLTYVSLFLDGTIGLPEILAAQGKIIAEHLLNNSFHADTLGGLGRKDRVIGQCH